MSKTGWRTINPRVGPVHYERTLSHGMKLTVASTMSFPYGYRATVFGRQLQSIFVRPDTAMEEADRHAKLALNRALETYREEGRAKKEERRRESAGSSDLSSTGRAGQARESPQSGR